MDIKNYFLSFISWNIKKYFLKSVIQIIDSVIHYLISEMHQKYWNRVTYVTAIIHTNATLYIWIIWSLITSHFSESFYTHVRLSTTVSYKGNQKAKNYFEDFCSSLKFFISRMRLNRKSRGILNCKWREVYTSMETLNSRT